jgi:hypothetical protein
MRKLIIVGILLVTFQSTVASAGARHQHSDPNAQLCEACDRRLSQPITYEARNRRMHDVVSDLRAMTGVRIDCGKNLDDWEVRDLALTMRVQGLKLDKVLRYIAFATYSGVIQQRIGGTRAYRIVRMSSAPSKDLCKAILAHRVAWGQWVLGTISALERIPDSQMAPRSPTPRFESDLARARAWSRLLKVLDPRIGERLMKQSTVSLSPRFAPRPLHDALIEVLRRSAEYQNAIDRPNGTRNTDYVVTPEQLEAGSIRAYDDTDGFGGISIIVPNGKDRLRHRCSLSGIASFVRENTTFKALPEFPGYLSEEEALPDQVERTSWRWFYLTPDEQTAFNKAIPYDSYPYADIVIALARSRKYNVVSMDFHSYKGHQLVRHDGVMRVDEVMDLCTWYRDETGRVLIGRSEYSMPAVPEHRLDRLKLKMRTDGLDLDDLTIFAREPRLLTHMDDCADLPGLRYAIQGISESATATFLWAFYDSLSVQDKALARSASGLPLRKFDRRRLFSMLRARDLRLIEQQFADARLSEPYEQRLADYDIIPTLVMKIETREYRQRSRYATGPWDPRDICVLHAEGAPSVEPPAIPPDTLFPGYLMRKDCTMVLEGSDHGRAFKLHMSGLYHLPYYTPVREMELIGEPVLTPPQH